MGPYFIENEVGVNIMVNGGIYRPMIIDFFEAALHGIDVKDVLFQ